MIHPVSPFATAVRFGQNDPDKAAAEALFREAEARLNNWGLEAIQKYGTHPHADTAYLAEQAYGKPATLEAIAEDEASEKPYPLNHYVLEKLLYESPRCQRLLDFLNQSEVQRTLLKRDSHAEDSREKLAGFIVHLSQLQADYGAKIESGALPLKERLSLGADFLKRLPEFGFIVGGDLSQVIQDMVERNLKGQGYEDDLKHFNSPVLRDHLSNGLLAPDETARNLTAYDLLTQLLNILPPPEKNPPPPHKILERLNKGVGGNIILK